MFRRHSVSSNKYASDPDFGHFAAFFSSEQERRPTEEKETGLGLVLELCALAIDHGTHTVVAGGTNLLYKFWKTYLKKSE